MKSGIAGYYQKGTIVATGEEFGYREVIRSYTFDSPLKGVAEDKLTMTISVATDENKKPLKRRDFVVLENGIKYVVSSINQVGLVSIMSPIKTYEYMLVEAQTNND